MDVMKRHRNAIKQLNAEMQLMKLLLHDAIDQIDRSNSENMEIRIRGEQMALAIEGNDWDLESAIRLADTVSCWREFQERACTCPTCEQDSVFAEEGDDPLGMD